MKSLVFRYRRISYFLIVLVNCCIPVLLFILQLAKDSLLKFSASSKLGSISIIDIVIGSFLFLFLVWFLFYLFASLRNNEKAIAVLKNVRGNSKRFWIGVISTFVSWNLAMCLIVIRLIDSSGSSVPELATKVLTYLFASIAFALGVSSNICLSMFEFKWNFDVFYSRYKDTIIDQVLSANPSLVNE